MKNIRSTLLAAALAAGATAAHAAETDVILVLDVSNSMWGQIDGVSKIEIARDVIGDLILDWDAGTNLGLVAYGHRREGDCTDIETVVPVGPLDVDAFVAQVNGLVPRGRTPLTDAVRQAAEALNYGDRPATVVLVSDGIETCNADPCALATELERTGVAFTAHVVGFDVDDPQEQAQLSCIAENTGGLFLSASNAEELASALVNVTESLPLPPDDTLIALEAIAADSGLIIETGVTWTVVSLDDENNVLTDAREARPELTLQDGEYVAIARTNDAQGQVQFSVVLGEDAIHRVRLESLLPEATVAVESTLIGAGTEFPVTWTGPDADGDFITIVPVGTEDDAYDNYSYTREGSPLDLLAPDVAGDYEVRYYSRSGRTMLASVPVSVTPIAATLEAADSAVAGSEVRIEWTGPDNTQDFITIVPVGADEGVYENYTRTSRGSPLTVRAPDGTGSYEIRYVSNQSRVTVASRQITLTVATATLEAADSVVAGSEVRIEWTGPDNTQDFITIVPVGAEEGAYENYTRTNRGSPLTVRAPDGTGAFEIRYVIDQSRRTVVSRPITLTEAAATLEAPDSVVAGSEVRVEWTGPDNNQDFITIVPVGAEEGAYENYTRTNRGSPLTVRAPDGTGAFEIRYVIDQSRRTVVSRPITLTEATATLGAPDSVVAGADIRIEWTGPDNNQDFITVVPMGAEEGSFEDYTRTNRGSPLTVRAPYDPGAYEIRYIMDQSRRTVASIPLTIEAATATLDPPATATPGLVLSIGWTGPDNEGDRIVIAEVGAAATDYLSQLQTRQGSPVELRAPDQPGSYEIRYLLRGQVVIAASTLKVE